jgi:hypothetical protein
MLRAPTLANVGNLLFSLGYAMTLHEKSPLGFGFLLHSKKRPEPISALGRLLKPKGWVARVQMFCSHLR